MKVIDLLNKIANGEEVPKKIKYSSYIFKYTEDKRIQRLYVMENQDNYLLRDFVATLNSEVEIIEENKKIGKYNTGLDNGSWNEESVKKGILEKNNIEDYLVRVMKEVDNLKFKVFEIIDKLNEVEK